MPTKWTPLSQNWLAIKEQHQTYTRECFFFLYKLYCHTTPSDVVPKTHTSTRDTQKKRNKKTLLFSNWPALHRNVFFSVFSYLDNFLIGLLFFVLILIIYNSTLLSVGLQTQKKHTQLYQSWSLSSTFSLLFLFFWPFCCRKLEKNTTLIGLLNFCFNFGGFISITAVIVKKRTQKHTRDALSIIYFTPDWIPAIFLWHEGCASLSLSLFLWALKDVDLPLFLLLFQSRIFVFFSHVVGAVCRAKQSVLLHIEDMRDWNFFEATFFFYWGSYLTLTPGCYNIITLCLFFSFYFLCVNVHFYFFLSLSLASARLLWIQIQVGRLSASTHTK